MSFNFQASKFQPNLQRVLLVAFACVLWIGGGASREDVLGQVIVRFAAWICILILLLCASDRPFQRGRAVLWLLGAGTSLVLAQLVPLPPDIWASLPGRSVFAEATAFSGEAAPWRPLAIVPSMALNALGSLVVPFLALVFATSGMSVRDTMLLRVLSSLVIAGMLLGLLQFSGVVSNNPLVNSDGQVSGTFANHNHFALMMAAGFLLIPAWVFCEGRVSGWKLAAILAAGLLLTLTILASGSRAGTIIAVVALVIGLLIVWEPLRRVLKRYPKWVSPALFIGVFAVLSLLVLLSILTDRAISVTRALTIDPTQDLRHTSIPTVFAMVREYFPVGAGVSGFDPLFRLHEPFALLSPTYFNHVHNDFVEFVLDVGLPGAVLMLAGFGWWLWMSFHAWRAGPDLSAILPKLGSALIFIVMLASIVDYPARTPMIMTLVIIAGVWLGGANPHKRALRREAAPL